MGVKKKTRTFDVLQVFGNVPNIMGLELTMRRGMWQGRYVINGSRHSWRRDKLKVAAWGGDIWVWEEGGQRVSLATWLVNYGGARDYKTAYRIMEGYDAVNADFTRSFASEGAVAGGERFVPDEEYAEYRRYALWDCPLFRWMSGLFGRERVTEAWGRYGATTDERGLAVWWYRDSEGRVCYDKRMRYGENGHRDKTFGGTRKYRVGDGFTVRPLFGAHVIGACEQEMPPQAPYFNSGGVYDVLGGIVPQEIENALRTQKINVVESEKTALLATIAFGGVWVATGGKGALRDVDAEMILWPDIDAASEWSERGDVCEWWLDAEKLGVKPGENWDLGDFIVILTQKTLTLRQYQQNISEK